MFQLLVQEKKDQPEALVEAMEATTEVEVEIDAEETEVETEAVTVEVIVEVDAKKLFLYCHSELVRNLDPE